MTSQVKDWHELIQILFYCIKFLPKIILYYLQQDPLHFPPNWILKKTAEGSMCAKLSENLDPLIRVSVNGFGIFNCDVCGQCLKTDHGLYIIAKNKTIREVSSSIHHRYKICPGVNNEKFAYLWGRSKAGILDQQKTFRSTSCSLLVWDDSHCFSCRSLGGAMRSAHSRHIGKENTPVKLYPQKRPPGPSRSRSPGGMDPS